MLGIGGSIFNIPFLTFSGMKMQRAIYFSIAASFSIAIVGTMTVILTGLHSANLPKWNLGYVYLPAWFFVSLGSVLIVPLGVRLSHCLPVKILRKVFSIVLLMAGFDLLIR